MKNKPQKMSKKFPGVPEKWLNQPDFFSRIGHPMKWKVPPNKKVRKKIRKGSACEEEKGIDNIPNQSLPKRIFTTIKPHKNQSLKPVTDKKLLSKLDRKSTRLNS